MQDSDKLSSFIQTIKESIDSNTFIKLIISNKRKKSLELKSVTIKPVQISSAYKLSFVLRFPTQDITKNYLPDEALEKIKELIPQDFCQAELYTAQNNWHVFINKKKQVKISKNAPTLSVPDLHTHDKQKKRLINSENNLYLKELGITTGEGVVKASMQDKYKQINKYIELIKGLIPSETNDEISVVDMGSGKGYLTFAIYDYLNNILGKKATVTGVEFRQNLVDKCNGIAQKNHFEHLSFIQGTIETSQFENPDMLIALHACDTATDEAIFRGIKSKAKTIICAPCCHKQIRKQLKPDNTLNLIAQYGILKERQAEILTDTIRSQILEAYGYSTKVFEFISTEHTPKNVMIAATLKRKSSEPDIQTLESIAQIKKLHGIKYHHLEKLLGL